MSRFLLMPDVMHTRHLNDGSQTRIDLIIEADFAIIQATNANGSDETCVDHADALKCFAHPFSRREWLMYPGEHVKAPRPLSKNADGIPRVELDTSR